MIKYLLLAILALAVIGGAFDYKSNNESFQLIINKNYRTTNMLWSLFCAKNEFNESLIISYGDISNQRKFVKVESHL